VKIKYCSKEIIGDILPMQVLTNDAAYEVFTLEKPATEEMSAKKHVLPLQLV
jgi:hypothetical protein